MPNEWWETFFTSPLWLEVQSSIWSAEVTERQAAAIAQLLDISPPDRVLDVPCGEGRLSIELAALGYRVTGVDITRPLLDRARQEAKRRGVRVDWRRHDMRRLPDENDFRAGFDGAFCAWGSFGFFDDAGNLSQLKAVARSLRPGGRFLADFHIMESLLPQFQKRGWHSAGEVIILEERSLDLEQGMLKSEWTLIKGAESVQQTSVQRLYTYGQLVAMLREAGFASWQAYESLSGEPFEFGSRRLVMVAQKPE
jgi:SAM-dependent methyltransferase